MRFQSIVLVRPLIARGAIPSFNEKVLTISAAERVAEVLPPGRLSCFRLASEADAPFMDRFEFELSACGRHVAAYPGWAPQATAPEKEGKDRQEAIWQIFHGYPYGPEDEKEEAHALLYTRSEDHAFVRSASLWLRKPLPETHGIAAGRALLLDFATGGLTHL